MVFLIEKQHYSERNCRSINVGDFLDFIDKIFSLTNIFYNLYLYLQQMLCTFDWLKQQAYKFVYCFLFDTRKL